MGRRSDAEFQDKLLGHFRNIHRSIIGLQQDMKGLKQDVAFVTGSVSSGMKRLTELEEKEMATWQEVKDAVKAETDETAAMKLLVLGIAQRLQDAINAGAPPAEMQAIVDVLKTDASGIHDLVVANTPAEPPSTGDV